MVRKYTQILGDNDIAKSAITAKGTQNWTGNFYSHSVNVEREMSARQSVLAEEEEQTDMNGISCLNAENGVCKTILASYWKTSEKKLAPGEKF